MAERAKLQRYGVYWDRPVKTPLDVEFLMIRHGGYVKVEGKRIGEGLFHHIREAQSIIWPEDDHHRWSDLILKTMCEERIVVVQGPRDCSKTRTLSKWALIDYWTAPEETLTIMTSTGIRELELRVWGDIKSLFQRAIERFPYLAGHINQANHGIFTDSLDERGDLRDMRRGVVCVPLLSGDGEWVGLDKFVGIKQKRRRLIGDECFPAGTLVDTDRGLRLIETIRPGEKVLSAIGYRPVVATSSRRAKKLVRIRFVDQREILCTPEHRILTWNGWKTACEVAPKQFILSANESLQELRKPDPKQTHLLACLLAEMDDHAGWAGVNMYARAQAKSKRESAASNAHRKSNESSGLPGESQCGIAGFGSQTNFERGKRHRTNQGRTGLDENVSVRNLELRNKDRQMERQRISSTVQSRFGISKRETSHRGGRANTYKLGLSKAEGCKERPISGGAWVESVEILEQGDPGFPKCRNHPCGCRVFNLHVAGHPSYSVQGLIVHNCQFIPVNYINALDAFDKGDFKGGFLGNPIGGNGKALDKIAEPVAGWTSLGDVTHTTTWKNKYSGITINLVGTDSPNFDKETPNKYPYLINQEDIDRVALRNGRDSAQFWTLIMGVRKTGVDAYRVLTIELCERNGAFNTAVWSGTSRTKVYAIDAGYGGDPCEPTLLEFGEDVYGNMLIQFTQLMTIPISVSSDRTVEDQIALRAKSDCSRLEVPDENVFFEAGMRATLAISMARIMSPAVNAVNAGGPATDRIVSEDLLTIDHKTGERRPIKCSEQYSKFVTEMWYSVRELVEAGQARNFPRDAAEEFAMREWRWVPGPIGQRYELETKPEFKTRNGGRSPNKADSLSIAVEGARRLGFIIKNPKLDRITKPEDADWLERELYKHRQFVKKHELSYR